jgi:hypothetical protein
MICPNGQVSSNLIAILRWHWQANAARWPASVSRLVAAEQCEMSVHGGEAVIAGNDANDPLRTSAPKGASRARTPHLGDGMRRQ